MRVARRWSMPGKTLTEMVREIGRLATLQAELALPDAELLERYIRRRDETAFEALLHRHGPLVFGVCRRLLYNAHDAEDAFQATFLILARKANSIVPRSSVGNWLYGVAYRVAARARKSACHRTREQLGVDLTAVPDREEPAEPDMAPLLHAEVERLPDKYRIPIVLCYLEGKTNEEAARQLQWPVGTVKIRLCRARELLHSRLSRRGVALSLGLLAANTLRAQAPAALVQATLQAALTFAAGGAAVGGATSVQAFALTKGVLKTMCLLCCPSLSLPGQGAWRTTAQPSVRPPRRTRRLTSPRTTREPSWAPGRPLHRNSKVSLKRTRSISG